jgi:hypothetical protein
MQLYRDGTLLLQELNHSALKETPMKRLLMRTIAIAIAPAPARR